MSLMSSIHQDIAAAGLEPNVMQVMLYVLLALRGVYGRSLLSIVTLSGLTERARKRSQE